MFIISNFAKDELTIKTMYSRYTQNEVEIIKSMRSQNVPYKKIGETLGRSEAAISLFCQRLERNIALQKADEAVKLVESQKSLKAFTPREMIKYLYSLGYRIKNNELVVLEERKVNLLDIINN